MRAITTALCVMALATPAAAQETFEARLEKLERLIQQLAEENGALREQLEALLPREAPPAPAPERVAPSPSPGPRIALGGQLRLRPEYRNRLRGAADDADGFVGQRARASVAVDASRVRALVEVQDARTWGAEASTVSNDGNVDLHQAYIALPDLGWHGLSLTVGRQELSYGDQRLIGALDWATTARSFDGGVVRYAGKAGSADLLAALVNDRRTAARGSGDLVLSGLYARFLRGRVGRELDAYVLNLSDGARIVGEAGGQDTLRVTTLGLRARYARPTGVEVSGEGAYQAGHRGPDGHSAHAFTATAGYVFGSRFHPTLRLGWDRASGDGDPRDGRSREFNNLFPTNHIYYGYADLLGWRNMDDVRGSFVLAPREGHQLSLDVHALRLTEARGAWKDAGGEVLGRDPSGQSGRHVGDELDLLYRFPLRKDLIVLLGYSAFFPGAFADRVRGAGTQSFGYAQVLFKF